MKLAFVFASVVLLCSCGNKIETGKTLSKQDLQHIKNIHLLDDDEQLMQFYSEYKNKVAGNFYTNKRIATYWLDENNTLKNKVAFAYYKDIIKIDTFGYAGATYCPYLLVTKKDSSSFKVSVDGKRNEITNFFNGVLHSWAEHKASK